MAEDLFDLKEISLKFLKEGMVGDLFNWKDQNKVRLGYILLKMSK